jgi:hypothetical protein
MPRHDLADIRRAAFAIGHSRIARPIETPLISSSTELCAGVLSAIVLVVTNRIPELVPAPTTLPRSPDVTRLDELFECPAEGPLGDLRPDPPQDVSLAEPGKRSRSSRISARRRCGRTRVRVVSASSPASRRSAGGTK